MKMLKQLLTLSLLLPSLGFSFGVTWEGQLMQADGVTPELDPTKAINIKVYDTDKSCLLYEENHTVDTTNDGYVSITIGDGTAAQGAMSENLFDNSVTQNCFPSGTETLAVSEDRKLEITVGGETMSPDVTVSLLPSAVYAKQASTALSADSVDVGNIVSAAASYFTYMPNNIACADQEVLKWNNASTRWECGTDDDSGGDITDVNAGTGLTGGGTSGGVTLNVDVGTTANKIVQLDGTGKLPAVDGSNLTGLDFISTSGGSVSGSVTFNAAVTIADGSQGAGKVLTSDGAGNASWQTVSGTGDFMADGSVAMTGNLDLGSNNLTNLGSINGVSASEISNIAINASNIASNTSILSNKLDLSGGTLTGSLFVSGSSVTALSFIGDGSSLTGISASNIGGEAIDPSIAASTSADGQILMWSQTNNRWEAGTPSTTGDITDVIAGTGLSGGAVSGSATLTLAPSGVTTTHILDGTITSADIASGSITADKLSFIPFQDDGSIAMSGQLQADPGTIAAPGMTFGGDTDTGLSNPGVNVIAFTTGSLERMRIDNSGNFGIGTTNPQEKLHVMDSWPIFETDSNDTVASGLNFIKSRGGAIVFNGDELGAVEFKGHDGTQTITAAYIQAEVDGAPGANDMPGRLVFHTTPDGSTAPAERMRINNMGNVGIGTITPGAMLHVNGTMWAMEICDENGTNCHDVSTGWGGGPSSSFSADGLTPMTGQLQGAATSGSASPAFTFAGDTDTGIYSPGPDTMAFSVNGLEEVGIKAPSGSNSPVLYFKGDQSTGFTTGTSPSASINLIVSNQEVGIIDHQGAAVSGSNVGPHYSFIGDRNSGMSSMGYGELGFATNNVERVRIKNDGSVAIGNIGVSGSTSAILAINSTTQGLLLPRMTSGQRTSIPSPVQGLLVWDTTTNSLHMHDGGGWQDAAVGGGPSGSFSDGSIPMTNQLVGYTVSSSAFSPAFTFSGDTDTGIYLSGNDQVGISANGLEQVTINGQPPSGSPNTILSFAGDYDTGFGHSYSSGSATLHVNVDGMESVAFTNQGIVLPASGSPTSPPLSFQNDPDTGLISMGTDEVSIVTGGSEHVVVNVNGDVGIGTITPMARLHVEGLIYQTGMGDSTYLGYGAGNNDDYATRNNVGIGKDALNASTTGSKNTAIGFEALRDSTTAYDNVAVGWRALNTLTTGNQNVAIGRSALASASATTSNAAFGHSAGTSATGDNNTFLGTRAGDTGSSGDNNILIGYNVQKSISTASYELNIGDTLFGDLSNNSVGIGVYPAANVDLHVTGSNGRSLFENKNNDTMPSEIRLEKSRNAGAVQNADTIGLISFRAHDGTAPATTADISAIATENHTGAIKGTDMIFRVTPNGSNTPLMAMKIQGDGSIGVGTNAPAAKFHLDGSGAAQGLCVTSDGNCGAVPGGGQISAEATLNTGADYAEYFKAEEVLKKGEIVGLNPKTGLVRKYRSGDQLLGIVSTDPGVIGNSNLQKDKGAVLVALVGQVPFIKSQVVREKDVVKTKDGKKIGFVLASGNVYLNISSADYSDEIAQLRKENTLLKEKMNQLQGREIAGLKAENQKMKERFERLEIMMHRQMISKKSAKNEVEKKK